MSFVVWWESETDRQTDAYTVHRQRQRQRARDATTILETMRRVRHALGKQASKQAGTSEGGRAGQGRNCAVCCACLLPQSRTYFTKCGG